MHKYTHTNTHTHTHTHKENLVDTSISLPVPSQMIQLDWGSPQSINRMYIRGYNIYYRRENDTQEEMLFIEGNRNKQFLIGMCLLYARFGYYVSVLCKALWEGVCCLL